MSHRAFRLAIVLLASVAAVGIVAPHQAGAQGKIRIAVMNFYNNSSWHYWVDNLGSAAADELATQLVKSGRFSVIERRELESIIAEQDLGASGRVNASTAAGIGQLLGAQLVVTGSITQFSVNTKSGGFADIGGSFTEAESILDVRVVNTVTGEIMVVSEGKGKKRLGGLRINDVNFQQDYDAGLAQEALRPAVEQAVEGVIKESGQFAGLKPVMPPASIVGSREGSYYIDRGENSGVQVSQRFAVMRVIDEIRDAQGNVLDQITDRVGLLEVTRVLGQSSICRLVEGEAAEGDTVTAQ